METAPTAGEPPTWTDVQGQPDLQDPLGWEQAGLVAGSGQAGWAGVALPLLTAGQEPVLGFWIEAGVLAHERLEARGWSLDALTRLELTRLVAKGESARERLIRSNVRLAYYWAIRRSAGRSVGTLDVEDLVAEGMVGIIHAVQMWDYQMGLKFSTYASGWIRSLIGRAATGSALVSMTQRDRDRLSQLSTFRRAYLAQHERTPTVAEVGEHLALTRPAARDLMSMSWDTRAVVSLDASVDPHDSTDRALEVIDSAPRPDEVALQADQGRRVSLALAALPERDRAIVCARVGWTDGQPVSEAELAARYGVTTEMIRTIAVRALATLRGDLVGLAPPGEPGRRVA